MAAAHPHQHQHQHPQRDEWRLQLLRAVETFPVTIVTAGAEPVVSSLSTSGATDVAAVRIPQYLHEAGWTANGRMVAVTHPRRSTVVSLAQRAAAAGDETGRGQQRVVGYAVPLDDCTDRGSGNGDDRGDGGYSHRGGTRIRYLTDALLLREAMADPLLSQYNAVVVTCDAHERSADSDVLLGLLKLILPHRADLRVVVVVVAVAGFAPAADADANDLLAYFSQSPPVLGATLLSFDGDGTRESSNHHHPVDVHFLRDPCEDHAAAAVDAVLALHAQEPPGDVLVFVASRLAVDSVASQLETRAATVPAPLRLEVVAVHGSDPTNGNEREQQKYDPRIQEPASRGARKVIVAPAGTTAAEESALAASPNVAYVVDCGWARQREFQPHTTTGAAAGAGGRTVLATVSASRARADLRAQLAGRWRLGKAYRLYPAAEYARLPASCPVPELARSDLTATVLCLKHLGVRQVAAFPFPPLAAPPRGRLAHALASLHGYGAVDDAGELTDAGRQMAELPLLKSHAFGCVSEALTIVAMLSTNDTFLPSTSSSAHGHDGHHNRHAGFAVEEGDHLTFLNVYLAYEAAHRHPGWCQKHRVNAAALHRARQIRAQLAAFLDQFGIPATASDSAPSSGEPVDATVLQRWLAASLYTQAAAAQPDGSFRLLHGGGNDESSESGAVAWLHPSSALFERIPAFVVYTTATAAVAEATTGAAGKSRGARVYLRGVTVVEPQWLMGAAPGFFAF
ncbi:hypothetical protein H9P43_002847 [Blastocladiella emersonii ATCC 22665]|nr:hypothetical protein H9P43_002847 [Blastocladiella emersonii ATCC 22665]